MKNALMTLALMLGPLVPAMAQASPQQVADANAAIAPDPGALRPQDWYKIGGPFGHLGHWQFGLDKSATAGACIGWNFTDREVLGGPCRDALLLARKGVPFAVIGGGLYWDASHAHSTVVGRGSLRAGPVLRSALDKLGEDVPGLEDLTGWKAPQWIGYIGKITSIDGWGGPRTQPVQGQHRWIGGAGIKADIPLPDLWALFSGK